MAAFSDSYVPPPRSPQIEAIAASGRPGDIEDMNRQLAAEAAAMQAQGTIDPEFDAPAPGFPHTYPLYDFNSPIWNSTPEQMAEEPSLGGALKRGALNVGADYLALGGMGAAAMGMDEIAEGLYEKSREWQESSRLIPRRIHKIEDVRSAKDLGIFAAESIVETLPLVASVLLPGGLGAKFGGKVAGYVAAGLSDAGIHVGESGLIAQEAGKDPLDVRVISSGMGKAALDFVPYIAIFRRFGLGPLVDKHLVKELAERGYWRRAGGAAGTIVATEVPTEVAQEVINIALNRSLRDMSGQYTAEEKSQILNAAAAAATFGLVGLGLGGRPRPVDVIPKQIGEGSQPPDVGPPPPPAPPYSAGAASPEQLGQELEMADLGRQLDDRIAAQPVYDEMRQQALAYEAKLDRLAAEKEYDPEEAEGQVALEAVRRLMAQGDIAAGRTAMQAAKVPSNRSAEEIIATEHKWQSNVQVTDPATVEQLKARGEQGLSPIDVMQRMGQGERIFAFHDMDEVPFEITRVEQLTGYTPDQLIALPAEETTSIHIAVDQGLTQDIGSVVARGNITPTTKGYLLTVDGGEVAITESLLDAQKIGESLLIEPVVAKYSDGDVAAVVPTPMEREATILAKAPPTPTGMQIIGIDAARQNATRPPVKKPRKTRTVTKTADLDRLTELHTEIISDETNYRKDGVLKNDAARKLRNLEARAEKVSKDRNVPNPLAAAARAIAGPIGAVQEQAEQGLRRTGNLTEAEQGRLAKLYERDQQRGLSESEYGEMELLIAKRDGETAAERRAATPQAVAELEGEIEQEILRAEAAEIDADEDLASIGPTVQPRLTKEQVIGFLAEIAKKLRQMPTIIVMENSDQLKTPLKLTVTHNLSDPTVKGLYRNGSVYIFSDAHRSKSDVYRTVLHEVGGHYGLRATMSSSDFQRLLAVVGRTRMADVLKWRENWYNMPTTEKLLPSHVEEYIAAMAEMNLEPTFMGRVIAMVRAAFRRMGFDVTFSDLDIHYILSGVRSRLKGRVPLRYARFLVNGMDEFLPRFFGDITKGSLEDFSDVWGARLGSGFLTPLQMAEQHKGLTGVQEYIRAVQQWWGRKTKLTRVPAKVAEEFGRLTWTQQKHLSKSLSRATLRSTELRRELTSEELKQLFLEEKVDEAGQIMFGKVQKSFKDNLPTLERSIKRATLIQHTQDPQKADKLLELYERETDHRAFIDTVTKDPQLANLEIYPRLKKIEEDMTLLKDRTYFPLMRFGRYTITVRDDKGKIVAFEAYEGQQSRSARLKELRPLYPGADVREGYMQDNQHVMLGMPPALFELVRDKLGLSVEQETELKEIYYKHSPGKAYMRHLMSREGTPGFSEDALRVYATYMMNMANHIARIEYVHEMGVALAALNKAAKALPQGTTAGVVADYFAKHNEYINKPQNDLAQLRAIGFLWYLGFNVKSAFVNLTQLPLVAHPFLAVKYGDVRATSALIFGLKEAMKTKKGQYINDLQLDKAIQRGRDEGFLDESIATELAGLGESDVLQRLMPESQSGRITSKVAYYGSFLFRHAEKFNREVAFIAARKLALEQGMNEEQAYEAAREAVQSTMFEYAKWNRPTFMRGKKSVVFLFWQYMQGLSYLAFGGKGGKTALRVWLMMGLAGGLQGLPFAENFMDLYDLLSTELKELFGVKDPKTEIRNDLRALALELTDNPDVIMHGLSRYYGLGPLHLLQNFGIPVPNVDISGSVSAGTPLPGIQPVSQEGKDPDSQLGRVLQDVLGPVMSIPFGLYKAMETEDPDTWKVWERALPTAIAGVSKAARRNDRAEESFRGGGAILKFDPNNMGHRMENVLQALGFSPTRLTQRYEKRASQEDIRKYWTVRRAFVIENYAYALFSRDPPSIQAALLGIRMFNQTAPTVALRVSQDTLERSLKARQERRVKREDYAPNEDAFMPLYSDVAQLYPVGP